MRGGGRALKSVALRADKAQVVLIRELLRPVEEEFTPKKKLGPDIELPKGKNWDSHRLPEVPDSEEDFQGFIRTTTIDNYQGEENKVRVYSFFLPVGQAQTVPVFSVRGVFLVVALFARDREVERKGSYSFAR